MLVDCHAHLVSDDVVRYPPSPLSGTLDRPLDDPMTAERLLREMDANHVERAVVVQRAHVYGYNNSYVVDAASRFPDRLVAVCCVDADDVHGPDRVRHWIGERGAVGIRLTEPRKGSGTGWLSSPHALATWQAATALGASVCLHMYRWNRVESLLALKSVLQGMPEAVVILDHLSNIAAEEGAPDYGVDGPLLDLAQFPNVYLKLTTINLDRWRAQQTPAAPVLSSVVQAFGIERLMWGSDLAQSKGRYDELIELGITAVASMSNRDRLRVLYETSNAVYGSRWG